jgi:hypothetical protein
MKPFLKPLAIAALSIAMLAPANADPTDLAAYHAITAYTLYRQVLTCESAYIQRAEALTTAIADKAKAAVPSLNLERSWRLAHMDPTGYPLRYATGQRECQLVLDNLQVVLSWPQPKR